MSIEDCFSYYSPFSPFSEPKITMEFPDHDQSQINSEEVSSVFKCIVARVKHQRTSKDDTKRFKLQRFAYFQIRFVSNMGGYQIEYLFT